MIAQPRTFKATTPLGDGSHCNGATLGHPVTAGNGPVSQLPLPSAPGTGSQGTGQEERKANSTDRLPCLSKLNVAQADRSVNCVT